MAKIETLLARHWDVEVLPLDPPKPSLPSSGVCIWLSEKNDIDSEPLGCFIRLDGYDTYQWRNIYTKIESGTAYTECMLRDAIRTRLFNSQIG